ncbi:MAG: DotU family type IV/VI secretion system protein [Gemmatimonadetes bacterium]|nr:DotU family type IV/VI secretion system protein [Gemmatimonadota bacterium]
MAIATLEPAARTSSATPQRRGLLALLLQEPFTAAIRLRANRQTVTDAEAFRTHIKRLLATADSEARRAGFDGEYVKLAVYAFVAFLDESVLNSNQPSFASWPRQPLQEEIFGDHMAGETFFLHLKELLGRQDSEELADLLEVFQLCLLLGFRGRYGVGDPGGLDGLIAAVQEKILRVRGGHPPLSPQWKLPDDEAVTVARDPWVPRLAVVALASCVVALLLFLFFRLSLDAGVADLQALTSQLLP